MSESFLSFNIGPSATARIMEMIVDMDQLLALFYVIKIFIYI